MIIERRREDLCTPVEVAWNSPGKPGAPSLHSSVARWYSRRTGSMGSVDVNLFLDAQAEVFKMMQKDNFVRYQKSKQFEALGEKMGFYKKQDKDTQSRSARVVQQPSSQEQTIVATTNCNETMQLCTSVLVGT